MADQTLDDFLGVKPQPAWRRHARWVGIALGVLLLLLIAYFWFGRSSEPSYATEPVARGNLITTVSATGKLAPTNQVTVGSQLSGLVVKVLVDVNDRVAQGQPLAEIDPEQIEDQIRQGRAQLAANQAQVGQARATLAEAQAQLARLEEVSKLSGGRVPSGTEMQRGRASGQRAQAALRVAEANVLASQAALSQNQTQRARAIIRSPVSGVVLARQVDPGQTVAASFNTPTLFVIAEDLSKMKLEVSIDEADVGGVKQGQRASFTVDAFPGRTFPAMITRVDIGSNLSVSSASFTPQRQATSASAGGITSALTPRPGRPGQSTQRTATMGKGALQTVYVKDEKGQPKAVQITTGDTDGFHTEMLSGDLRAGMEVITSQLANGSASQSGARQGNGAQGSGAQRGGSGGGG